MPNKLCKDYVSAKVCRYRISIEQAINTLDTKIRYPSDAISDHYFNDRITKDLKTLKESALKLTGKHCMHFKSVK